MNAIGMQITTVDGPMSTINDLDVSATRLFTNRMKLGEFDPDATRAVADAGHRARQVVRGVPVVERDRSDRDRRPARAGPQVRRRGSRAAEERRRSRARTARSASCCRSRCRRPAPSRCSCSARWRTSITWAATRRSRAAPGRRTTSTPYAGDQGRDPGGQPGGPGGLPAGLHGHEQLGEQLLHDDRPGGRDGRGGLRLRDRLHRHRQRRRGARTGTARRSRCPASRAS